MILRVLKKKLLSFSYFNTFLQDFLETLAY